MDWSRPAVHRTIVVMDVEGFGDPSRTNVHQVAVRTGLYRALRQAFDEASVPWAGVVHEDRGDGVFILAPSDVPKAFFIDAVPHALAAALRGHNATHAVEARIRLRMALHAGEVELDEHGVTGTAVNLTFRLVDSPAVKAVLAESPGVLATIVSGWFFDEVVRHSRRTDPATFRSVRVTVKETSTMAWTSRPDHPYPPDRAGLAISGTILGSSVVQTGTIQKVVLPQTPPEPVLVPRQLPAAVPDFIGRTDQLTALDELLPDHGQAVGAVMVAVVDGPGGIGKTSLVVRWAHRVQEQFPDGTLFANLCGYGPSAPLDPAVVLATFLPALGVPDSRIPTEMDALVGLYRSLLAEKRVLIVLDNAASAEQVLPLLPGVAGCVVVTSRDTLTALVMAQAARRINLEVFPAADAETLLRVIIGSRRVDAEPGPVANLVRICAGLPLAVRVAATRVVARPQLDIADVVADIVNDHRHDSRGTFGGGGAVESVFDWSYARLPSDQARVFRRLGLHPSPEFGVPAAAALTDLDTAAMYRYLEALAELHLIEPVGRKRYRMHDLLHAYAAHRADIDERPQDRHVAVTRVLAWYARTTQLADHVAFPPLTGTTPNTVDPVGEEITFADRVEALAWSRLEQTNLLEVARHAAERGSHELVMALAAATRFMSRREHSGAIAYVELVSWAITAAQTSGHRAMEALLHSLRGGALHYLGRLDDAESDYQRQLAIADELNDPIHRMNGLSGVGWVRLVQNRPLDAREYYQKALPLTRGVDSGFVEAAVRGNLSQISTHLGEFEQALDHANQEVILRRQALDQAGAACALHHAALAWQGMGQHPTAIDFCRQAASAFRTLDEIGSDLGSVLLTLATSLELSGDLPAAVESFHEAVDLLTSLDDPRAEQTRQRLAAVTSQIASDPGD